MDKIFFRFLTFFPLPSSFFLIRRAACSAFTFFLCSFLLSGTPSFAGCLTHLELKPSDSSSSSEGEDDELYSRRSALTTGRTLTLLAFIVVGIWQLYEQQRLGQRSRRQLLRGVPISPRRSVLIKPPTPMSAVFNLNYFKSRDSQRLVKNDLSLSKCACESGNPRDGGKPVDNHGECHFCCSPHNYCGTGFHYCRGSFTNCKDGKGSPEKKYKLPSFAGTLEEVVEAPPGMRAPGLAILSASLEWRDDGKCGPGFPSKTYAFAACDPRGECRAAPNRACAATPRGIA